MIKNGRLLFLLLFVLFVFNLGANETKDGYIKMTIDEKTGRYSLFFLSDPANTEYSQLFYGKSNTSFLDINVNGVYYRLGSSGVFKTRIDMENEEPVVVYESSFLTVKESFTPVKTTSSPTANGIRITIKITNKSDEEPDVGLRMLLDTTLGEGRKKIPFVTENINIINEKIIEGSSDEKYWISRGKDIALMGSIADPLDVTAKRPDFLHFANWKKLSDVPWKASYHEGRSFNNLPYSIGDSAVSYYWEPCFLELGGTLTYTVYLTTEDTAWYYPELYARPEKPVYSEPEIIPEVAVYEPEKRYDFIALIEKEAGELSLETNEDFNVVVLRLLQNYLNRFIAGEIILNEDDITQIDFTIEKYREIQEKTQ